MCGWWGRWARTCSCWACRRWSQLTRTRCVGVCAAVAIECGADCCGTKEAAALGDAATEAAQAAAVSDMHPALHDPQELKKIAAFLKVSRVIVLCPVVACAYSDALLSATTVTVTPACSPSCPPLCTWTRSGRVPQPFASSCATPAARDTLQVRRTFSMHEIVAGYIGEMVAGCCRAACVKCTACRG